MLLTDVNLLVYAANKDHPEKLRYQAWLKEQLNQPNLFGVSELVLSGFVRIVTHPRILSEPIPFDDALRSANRLRGHRNCSVLQPGPRHWDIFTDLCTQTQAAGNDVADAYHAALAIEHDCEWITNDSGFNRFPGLRWRRPFEA